MTHRWQIFSAGVAASKADLRYEVASYPMLGGAGLHPQELGLFLAAYVYGDRAAGVKAAAAGWVQRAGNVTFQDDALPL